MNDTILQPPRFDHLDVVERAFPGRFPKADEPVISPEVPKGQIPIGTTRDGRIYYLDATKSFRAVIVGPPGKGKTWLLRLISDWLNLYQKLLLFVNDTSNEVIYSAEPNRKHQLPPFAKPTPNTRLRRWVVEWLAQPHEPNKFSLRIADLEAVELQYLLGINDNSPKQILVLEELVEYFRRRVKQDPEYRVTFKELDAIRRDPSIVLDTYRGDRIDKETYGEPLLNIYYRLYSLLKKKIVETDNKLNPLGIITGPDGKKDRHVILDWSSEKLKKIKNPTSWAGTCISIIIDRVFEARRRYNAWIRGGRRGPEPDYVPPLYILWDEGQPFIAEGMDNFPSMTMKAVARDGRKESVGLIICYQTVGETDDVFLALAEHLFIFETVGEKELQKIQRAFPSIFPDNYQGRENLAQINDIQGHEFFVINRITGERAFVTAYPPLSKHMEESTER